MLEAYTRQALKVAEVAALADDEGVVARIPGFSRTAGHRTEEKGSAHRIAIRPCRLDRARPQARSGAPTGEKRCFASSSHWND